MTKSEELKLLGKIVELIDGAGADSYIGMTFAGVPDVCRRNIENDFGDMPVFDGNAYRESLLKIEHERDAMAETIKAKDAEIEKLGHMLDAKVAEVERLREERDVLNECVIAHNEMTEKTDKILRQSLMKAYANEVVDCGDDRYGYVRAVREITKALGFSNEEIWNVERYVRCIADTDEDLVATMSMIALSSIREERDD